MSWKRALCAGAALLKPGEMSKLVLTLRLGVGWERENNLLQETITQAAAIPSRGAGNNGTFNSLP